MLKCVITLLCVAFTLQDVFSQTEIINNDCQTPDKNYGSCINLMQCQSLVKLVTKRKKSSEEEAFLKSSSCGYDNVKKDPKVCCPFQNTCGRNFQSTSDRIVGGRKSALGDWPWMAALGIRNSRNDVQWICGGALISNKFVLTAAHCVHEIKVSVIRLGELNLNPRVADGAKPIDFPVARILKHQQYNPKTVVNDIALIKLEKTVTFNELIQPICLPIPPTIRNNLLVKMEPTVTGWGATQWKGATSDDLLEVTVSIYDENKCKRIVSNYSKLAVIDQKILCAGDPNNLKRDSCQGDSGGPLMWPKFGQFYLVGIVSYGFECAIPGVPGVYTRVSSFIDWISENMNKN